MSVRAAKADGEGLERLGWLPSVPVWLGCAVHGYGAVPLASRVAVPIAMRQVAAPSKLERPPGNRVKNDRRNAFQLARLVRPGDIVQVRVPTVEQEAGPGPGPGRRPGRFDAGQASVVEAPAAPRHRLQRRHHLGCRNDASTSVVVSPIQLLRVIVRRKRPHSGLGPRRPGESPEVTHRLVARLAGLLPDAQVATIAGANHLLPLTHPAELADLITSRSGAPARSFQA